MIFFLSTTQVNIFQHAAFAVTGQGKTELLFLRMAVTNSVIDPWIYILFRKEVMIMLVNFGNRFLGRNTSSPLQKSTASTGKDVSETKRSVSVI